MPSINPVQLNTTAMLKLNYVLLKKTQIKNTKKTIVLNKMVTWEGVHSYLCCYPESTLLNTRGRSTPRGVILFLL